MSILTKKHFANEPDAFEYLESTLWADGVVCPHCGTVGNATRLGTKAPVKGKRSARLGLWKCKEKKCRKQFTVKVGTVFEHGRIPLHKMLQAVYLMTCSKKGISAHQLHRILQIQYKSAWFLAHRIREAMRSTTAEPLGGSGKVVEADETFIGRIKGMPKGRSGWMHKNMVLTLVERGGSARSFHVDGRAIRDIMPIVRQNVARETRMNTDEAKHYYDVKLEYAGHDTVTHKRRRIRALHHRSRVCRHDQCGRRLLLNFQARHERRVSALQREAFASLSCRV
jgi:transposase-like protein